MNSTLLEKVVLTAEDELRSLGWERQGEATFKNVAGSCLILKVGNHYPKDGHHSDDGPTALLFYKERDGEALEIQIPFLMNDEIVLRWTSNDGEVSSHVSGVIENFRINYIDACPASASLLHFIIFSHVKHITVLNGGLFQAMKNAIEPNGQGIPLWIRTCLSLFKEQMGHGKMVFTYDPVTDALTKMKDIEDFTLYVEKHFVKEL